MVRVQCPHCQRRYRTEIGAFGRTAVCSKCSQSFKIGESRPPFQWKTTDLAEDSWIGTPPPEEKQEMKHCIICDAPLRPDMYRCPECGANQVTGVVHRSRPVHREEKASFWSMVPLRALLLFLGVVIVGGGVYWGFELLTRKTQEVGEELADNTIVARAARELREGADDRDILHKYAGHVNDANLSRFLTPLSAENAQIRRAATLLIAAGKITQLDPLLIAANSPDARISEPAKSAIEAIGPRRLLELSCDAAETVRKPAADALLRLFDLEPTDPRVDRLSKAMTLPEKKALLNEACRLWPYLVGTFVVRIEDQDSPFTVEIEQLGRTFYMNVGPEEFRTSLSSRRFEIPVYRWCAATGAAVDVKSVRQLLDGSIQLESTAGVEWTGSVELISRRKITGPPPGFLPLPMPEPGKHTEAAVRLIRPSRPGGQ